MKTLSALVFAGMALAIPLRADEPAIAWQHYFGGSHNDGAVSILYCGDGCCIVAGWTNEYKEKHGEGIVLMVDSLGSERWSLSPSGCQDGYLWSIQQTADSSYISVGAARSNDNGKYNVYLVKITRDGKMLWQRTYNGTGEDKGNKVLVVSDGYLIAGSTTSFGNGKRDMYVIKTDTAGGRLWEKNYGGAGDDYAWDMAITKDGGIILVGGTISSDSVGADVFVIRTDSIGHELWHRSYGGRKNDEGRSVVQSGDGYIIVGGTESAGKGCVDQYIIGIDKDGNELWHRTNGAKWFDWLNCITPVSGGFLVAGAADPDTNGMNGIYLGKINDQGRILWQKVINGISHDWANSICTGEKNRYFAAGVKNSDGHGLSDMFVIKLLYGKP